MEAHRVTLTATQNPVNTDNVSTSFKNSNGINITNTSKQEVGKINIKGLSKTPENETITLKIAVDGKELLNVPITVKEEAPKTIAKGEMTEPATLYLEEQAEGTETKVYIPVYLTSEDVEKDFLKRGDVKSNSPKVTISIPGIDDTIANQIFIKEGYNDEEGKKVPEDNNNASIEYMGIEINTGIINAINSARPELMEVLKNTNKITINYEGKITSSFELNVRIVSGN